MNKLAIGQRIIALYVDVARDSARALAARIAAGFRSRGYQVATWKGQQAVADLASNGVRAEDAALFITVGGDGTLLRAARLATEIGSVPLLGVNTGRLGFLTELDDGDPRIAQLPQLVDEGLLIDERAALEAEYANRKYFALNDVVVVKGEVSRIVPFDLTLDNEHIAEIPADGICIATATGSTAYFLSAGGSIISPRVDAFGIVPLLPHTLFSRPLIVPASSEIGVGSDSEAAHAHLECDGDVLADVEPNSIVHVRRYPKVVRFARLSPLRFFERLTDKMRWGVSIKAVTR
ncbi:MAG TPA: NAD(+)/NADH kinase [Candidatus Baltobacteraceae bacterium]|nr:NAD(+)/NADH kinase [Candidatus Baltobacteraceae bacterium]HTX56994.1 NAD(+)/NADH kinase [Candidatus Acidoferrales bacterium]